MILHLAKPLLDIFFPQRCALCERDTIGPSLCSSCLSLCHKTPDPLKIGALFYYELGIRDLIIRAKFHRSIMHAHVLEELIKKSLDAELENLRAIAPDAVTYVPTHWLKRSWRALDIPLMFAKAVALKLEIPLVHSLKRTKFGSAQSAIKERIVRQHSVQSLFALLGVQKRYERLLVVDDITTTGATLHESSKILKSLSPQVYSLAVAKTP